MGNFGARYLNSMRADSGFKRPKDRVLIVGAGHAGASAAAYLRQQGFQGSISLIGEERMAPYQRPPLSKAWLLGKSSEENILLRPRAFYEQNNIDLVLGLRVEALDRDARGLKLSDGSEIFYDRLVLATGARARRMNFAGSGRAALLELRTAIDAEQLKDALKPGSSVVIIGGGYIGLEAAASARMLNARVTVIEREKRVLARVACAELSGFFESYHRDRGVQFRFNQSVVSVETDTKGRKTVTLADGERLFADAVLMGVGAVPNEELAAAAGLECEDGIVVNADARTADPFIYAIGDCTRRPLALYQRTWRLESVPNALEQAMQATAAICARPAPAMEVPWFWSDQYDLKLQIAGLPFDVQQLVVRGDPQSGRFAVFHLDACNRVQAVEAINAVPEFVVGRRLIASRGQVNAQRLKDPKISMKEIAA